MISPSKLLYLGSAQRAPTTSDETIVVVQGMQRVEAHARVTSLFRQKNRVIYEENLCEKKSLVSPFRNKKFAFNEMFQRNASKFAIFNVV